MIPASLKTENTFDAAVNVQFHIQISLSRVIRPILDEIYYLGHVRNAMTYYCLPLSFWQMLYLCFTAQAGLLAWKCFGNVQVELWTDRFRLRSLSHPKRLSTSCWGENLEQRSQPEFGESVGSTFSVKDTDTF